MNQIGSEGRRANRLSRGGAAVALALTTSILVGINTASAEEAVLQPGSMQARLVACTACHGEQGRSGPDAYYPRIAGKPATYLYNQLVNFRDGYRTYPPMQVILRNLSDDYLREIAQWFAEQQPEYDPPVSVRVAPALLKRGQQLAEQGDAAARIPACTACHGEALTGVQPGVPGLLGIPRDYIASQFGSWVNGMRNAAAPDCMEEIALRMTPEDIAAVAAWLATQPVPGSGEPASAPTEPLPMECGSQPVEMTASEVSR